MLGNLIPLVVLVGIIVLLAWLTRRAWRSKRAPVKWVGVVAAGTLSLLCTLGTLVVAKGFFDLYRPYPVAEAHVSIAGTPEQIARGEQLAAFLCASCHSPNGGAVFSPSIAEKVLSYLSAPPPSLPAQLFDELTARERGILELVAQGKTNAEIATTLNLSAKTVSNYISNVLLKLHAADRAKLMLMALEAGMGQTGKS